jgi:hypothetical protein
MKIVNDALTASMRRRGPCRYCGKVVDLCGHHIWSKGSGGPDIACNLIALGMPLTCLCHKSHHDGNEPTFDDLLALSAADNDCLQGDIESLVNLIRRMPKWNTMSPERYERIVRRELNFGARRLAMRELQSFKHLWPVSS